MTYQAERTNLFTRVGRQRAEELLPKAFRLWYSDHSTGIQMTIVTAAQPVLPVWKGSIWHSHIYEFNDRDDVPGMQPGFEFAAPIIEGYFAELTEAADANEERRRQEKQQREINESRARDHSIEQTAQALMGATPTH